jgi:hypothetical protein
MFQGRRVLVFRFPGRLCVHLATTFDCQKVNARKHPHNSITDRGKIKDNSKLILVGMMFAYFLCQIITNVETTICQTTGVVLPMGV